MNVTKDSYLQNSKVAFLKSGQNAAGIFPFFYGALLESVFEKLSAGKGTFQIGAQNQLISYNTQIFQNGDFFSMADYLLKKSAYYAKSADFLLQFEKKNYN